LKLLEIVPPGSLPRDRLTFTLRVNLRTWAEEDPPPRSLEVESLAREFLARFPTERIRELGKDFERARAVARRLKSLSLTGPREELVPYPQLIDDKGGLREGITEHTFFFVFEGREFLVEDHYCVNPDCDCRTVTLEFWERTQEFHPQRHVTVRQRLIAAFTLEGKLSEVRFTEEPASTTKYLLLAWTRRGDVYFPEYRRRYEQIKAVGKRSFPPTPETQPTAVIEKGLQPEPRKTRIDAKPHVGRNDPCPCGSGLKYKRCCARRVNIAN